MSSDAGGDKADLDHPTRLMNPPSSLTRRNRTFAVGCALVMKCRLFHESASRTEVPARKPQKGQMKTHIRLLSRITSSCRAAEVWWLYEIIYAQPSGQADLVLNPEFPVSVFSLVVWPDIYSGMYQ